MTVIYNNDGTVEVDGIVYSVESDDLPRHDNSGIPVEVDDTLTGPGAPNKDLEYIARRNK